MGVLGFFELGLFITFLISKNLAWSKEKLESILTFFFVRRIQS